MTSPADIRSLCIILTARCNLACSYCYQNDKKSLRMPWETLRAVVHLALGGRSREVELSFFGGEPLLEFPLLRRTVAYAQETFPTDREVRFSLVTNGTLLDKEVASFLVAHRFETQLGFDGVPLAQNLRGGGTFDVLDHTLDRLQSDHPAWYRDNLSVGMTLSSRTIPHLADSIEYFLEKGLGEIVIAPLITHDAGWNDDGLDTLDLQFSRIHRACLHHYLRRGRTPLAGFRPISPRNQQGGTMCGATRPDRLTVDVDGQLYGCASLAGSFQKITSTFLRSCQDALRIGHLSEPELVERRAACVEAARGVGIFTDKDEKYSSYGRCGDCCYLDTCMICPVAIGHVPGNTDPHRVPDFQCAYQLVLHKYREKFLRQTQILELARDEETTPELLQKFVESSRKHTARSVEVPPRGKT